MLLFIFSFFPSLQVCGTTVFIQSAVTTLRQNCQTIVGGNQSFWEIDIDGNLGLPGDILDLTCPFDCSDNGDCILGR